MKLDRYVFELYWSYYKSIEKMFENTFQYVSPSKSNKKTYSDEYAKIILLCGSEIDSILKQICKLEKIKPIRKDFTMNDYSSFIVKSRELKESCYCPTCMTASDERFIIASPFANIAVGERYSNLDWWSEYQKLKHDRLKHARKGNLNNVVSILVAYYILIRYLINYLDGSNGKKYVFEHNVSNVLIPCV